MPIQAIRFGYLLIAVGIIGYGYGWANGNASITALIPAFFGLVLHLLGYFSNRKQELRKILMHVAVLVGILGFISAFSRIMMKINDITISAAFISQVAMSLICLTFVVLCVKSFINARKAA